LVDGPFQLVHRTLTLPWRGSSNQRVIDMPATLRGGRAVEWADRAGNLR
jgi:anaerobic ribonucleoside-triphosphate reductase activating protein